MRGVVLMNKFKSSWLLLTVCAVILLAAAGYSERGLAAPAYGKDTVETAYRNLHQLQSCHVTSEVNLEMVIQGKKMTMVAYAENDTQLSPLKGKNVVRVKSVLPDATVEQTMVQYLEQSGSQVNMYTGYNDKWRKQVLPAFNTLEEYEKLFKSIKEVAYNGEKDGKLIFNVLIDGKMMEKDLKKYAANLQVGALASNAAIWDNMGDFTYTLYIDKTTLSIVSIDMDMSSMMHRFGNNLVAVAQLPPERTALLEEMFKSIKITVRADFSQFNTVKPIQIPEEIR